ncbi:MAG TPA: nucleotidyltransferase domain-containing protein [Candidatus Hydrogenedentes bacterium]|nr:nucleotidyltransferase domain-containing protein [Candidatus Hydrogenedentota bacterium]HNT87721.1 nucleotidyltransferase domain-containing protein [Candidatus Hydrogenedentota bacterium]
MTKRLEEASTISDSDRELLLEVKSTIRRFLPEAKVLLYGSTARGERGRESDYDILVLTPKPLPPDVEQVVDDALYDLELERGVVLAVTFWPESEWVRHTRMPFRKEVAQDGIVL